MTDEYEASYTTQGNTFYYDTREFTEEQIKALDLSWYINSDEGDGWQVVKVIFDTDGGAVEDICIY